MLPKDPTNKIKFESTVLALSSAGRQIADMKRMAANMRDTCVAKKETMKHD